MREKEANLQGVNVINIFTFFFTALWYFLFRAMRTIMEIKFINALKQISLVIKTIQTLFDDRTFDDRLFDDWFFGRLVVWATGFLDDWFFGRLVFGRPILFDENFLDDWFFRRLFFDDRFFDD